MKEMSNFHQTFGIYFSVVEITVSLLLSDYMEVLF